MLRRIPMGVALVLGVIGVGIAATVIVAGESSPGSLPLWLGLVVLVATSLPLLAMRVAPTATVVAVVAGAIFYQGLDLPGGAASIPPIIALFNAMRLGRRAVAISGAAVWLGGTLALGWLGVRPPGTQGTVWFVTMLVALLIIGEFTRNRREQLSAERENAERAREEEARRRVTDERLRIARELHDLLAHSISVINLQAGVSEHLIDRDPEQARRALGDIRKISKEVLVELRGALGVLRDVDEGDEPLAPAPGMDRLPELVRRAESGGLDVALSLPDDCPELPKSVDLAVYRIIQEALTNVIKHAEAGRADVMVRWTGGELLIDVRDNGVGPPRDRPLGEGNGLVGMRERATSLNGAFDAGPGPEGGFAVHARLPARSVA